MPTCIRCGKIDTNLRDGVCSDCLRTGVRPVGSAAEASKAPLEPSRRPRCARPSRFIANGLSLSVLGMMLAGGSLDNIRSAGAAPFLALVGLSMAIAGSILLSVGIIRWAIWPLIERRDG